ncbi:MAG: hypothetical protein RL112_1671 [Planctomycetota bacterium]
MRLASLVILSLCLLLQGARAPGVEKRESWPDGSHKARWSEDEQGRLDGVREEYAANGVRTLLAEYKQGRKHGAWREWSPTGARLRFLSYKEGELDGRCEEFHPDGSSASVGDQRAGARHGKWIERSADGRRRRNLEYKAGLLHGELKIVQDDKLLTRQQWKDGELFELDGRQPFPVRRDALLAELRAILAQDAPEDPKDAQHAERLRALHRLQLYRRLCGLPWERMQLVPEWNLRCAAAAEVCRANGGLDHTPGMPPGFDEARFKLGYEGASNSNLSRGTTLPRSIDGYMDDSDPSNIDRIGHRRWCLNPAMKRTGFGAAADYSAMWSMDSSGPVKKGLSEVHYPPRGHVPVDLYSADRAFSIALWRGAAPRTEQLVVRVEPLDADWLVAGEPLELDHRAVAEGGYGGAPCIVFRAPRLRVEPGSACRVRASFDGGKTFAHDYIVAFCEPVEAKAAR